MVMAAKLAGAAHILDILKMRQIGLDSDKGLTLHHHAEGLWSTPSSGTKDERKENLGRNE